MTSFTSLPDEVLKLVMQHVPLRHRLTSCCLVSRRVHAALIAATDCLELDFTEDMDEHNLDVAATQPSWTWLSKYGQHLTSLYLNGLGWPLLDLPCPNLQKLTLSDCAVQLAATADGQSGGIQQCTKLTSLELFCNILDAPVGAVVNGLSKVVHLQHLSLHAKDLFGAGMMRAYFTGGLSDGTLPCLQHLTSLNVQGLSAANLMQLGDLTRLDKLRLENAADTVIGPSTVPGMAFPASLKTLLLFSPVEAEILSLVPANLQELWVECAVRGPTEGPGSFLSCMARLQHLTKIVLLGATRVAWPAACPAYSALTASRNLVHLELADVGCPAGVWSHVFNAARKLPHLTSLVLKRPDDDETGILDWPTPSWGAVDLSNLVSCCPSLHHIDALHLQHGLHVSELHKLTAFKYLNVYYAAPDFDHMLGTSMKGLAAVSQLQYLHIIADLDWKASSLLPLTSLTNLTSFNLTVRDGDEEPYEYVEPAVELWTAQYQQQAHRAPDVWMQLLEHCAADPDCQPRIVRSLAQLLAEQRALTVQLQDRVTAQEQLVSDQQQRMLAQDQLNAGQQQQIAAQQQQIAGLQGQLQELHAAVQQLLASHRQ